MVATMPSTFGTQRRISGVGGCRVGFANDTVYAKASYDHCYMKLLGTVLMRMPFVHDTTKSSNLQPGVPQTAPRINVSARGFRRKVQRVSFHVTNPCWGSAAIQRPEIFALLGF
jgi:hypothetical protein